MRPLTGEALRIIRDDAAWTEYRADRCGVPAVGEEMNLYMTMF
jgi:hypothetical protein